MSISLYELMIVIATEFLSLSSLIQRSYIIQLVQISSNGSFSLMKSAHCFPKMSLGTYTIVQKIVNSLRNVLLFFLGKNYFFQAFAEKKLLKHNIRLSKGRKYCCKRGKCLCGKGFQCTIFSNLRNLIL